MKYLRVLRDGEHESVLPLINQADHINAAVLAAGVKEDFTVPADAGKVLFSSTENFYCRIGAVAVAAVPAADITDGSSSELNPIARGVVVGETISLISVVDCKITMAFYR